MENEINHKVKMKKEVAYWVKQFSLMKESDFDNYNDSGFSIIQRIAYNYVKQSKKDIKIAEKVIDIVQGYDASIELGLD